jgi:hypothetical protein
MLKATFHSLRRARRSPWATALIVGAILSACDKSPSGIIPATPERVTALRASPTVAHLAEGEDQRISSRIARQIPGFGGAFFDRTGTLNVYVTDGTPRPAAREVIVREVNRVPRRPFEIQFLTGRYDWEQLQRWRFAVLNLLTNTGAPWSEVDETANGIKIGVLSAAAQLLVEQSLNGLGVPREAIAFELTQTGVALQALADRVRPFQGATAIEGYYSQPGHPNERAPCTYGANTTWSGRGGQFMVMNSHCTQADPPKWGWIGASVYQNIAPQVVGDSASYIVGEEISDPAGFTTGCPGGYPCRYSDAALVNVQDGMQADQGYIARPVGAPTYLPAVSGPTTIDAGNPRIELAGVQSDLLVSDTVQKIGSASGWTAGIVANTCRDILFENQMHLCQAIDSLSAQVGDSGSPILWQSYTGAYYLAGLLWGGVGSGGTVVEAWFSHWNWISYDLTGSFSALNPLGSDLSVYITGPQMIWASDWYIWTAHVSGGTGSNSYIWEQRWKVGLTQFGAWSVIGGDVPAVSAWMCGKGGPSVFEYRVTVTSGGRSRSSNRYEVIANYPTDGSQQCPQ